MADDIMEISSDHGGHGAEDIDFDFEVTELAGDEDVMLDDAYHTDLGSPHPSPGMGNDDLMLDEEDHDTSLLDDADLLSEGEEQSMDHEAMSFTSVDDTNRSVAPLEVSDGVGATSNSGDQQGDVGVQETFGNHGDFTLESHLPEQGDAALEAVNIDTKDFASEAQVGLDPGEIVPEDDSSAIPSVVGATLEHHNPHSNHEDVPEENDLTKNSASALPADQDEAQSFTADTQAEDVAAPTCEVLVLYQSNEYALFSTSELDDPDSYFLSDRALSGNPLAEIFAAIRGIIHGDLGDEDELCLCFKDLELEIEEVSSTLQDVTLTQILNLYEKLLSNDGSELQPLYVQLSVRKGFSKRIANLTTGATEGKGLSEFRTWSEHSESVNELGAVDQNSADLETPLKAQQFDDLFDEENLEQPDDELGAYAATSHAEGGDEELSPTIETAVERQSAIESLDVAAVPDLASGESPPTKAEDKAEASGEFDEDGDIIDYSEDEFDAGDSKNPGLLRSNTDRTGNGTATNFFPPACYKPDRCFCSKCSALLVAEYAAFNENEELRRRSNSRAAQSPADQPTEDTTADTNESGLEEDEEHGEQYENNEFDDQKDTAHLDEGIFDLGEGDTGQEFGGDDHLDFSHENFEEETAGEQHEDTYDLEGDLKDYLGNDKEVVGDEQPVDHENPERHDLNAEDWEDQNLDFSIDLPAHKESGEAETAESSGTISAEDNQFDDGHEEVFIDPSNNSHQEPWELEEPDMAHDPNDEIGFDDEEEEDLNEAAQTGLGVPTEKAEKHPLVNGKRPRADAELDDALDNQDAKRPRSRS